MLLSILSIIGGLAGLVLGGDWLVDGASDVARRFKMSPMVIGLTIVAFGTSAPELIVSIQASLGGNPGIALGNVVGSNIANIALILGVTALLCPIPVKGATIKIDTPFLVFATVALTLISYFFGTITRIEGLVALLMLILFVAYQIYTSKQNIAEENTPTSTSHSLVKGALLIVVGIAGLKFGAQFLVDGAVSIAQSVGVSDRIIGLTVVAVGTSLPELFASVVAARKGNVDLAVGNVVGSNLFNIMCVLATASVIQPIEEVGAGFTTDCLWMLGLTLLIWFQLRTDYRLTRLEGVVLVLVYATYLTLLVI